MAKIISSLPGSTGVLSKTSQLINDGETGISTYVELNDLSTVATTGDYNNLINIPIDFTPKVHTHNISDISGTKSEFNTSLIDGDFLFVGDVLDTPDATVTTKGILKLTGDLGGTADNPTTPTAIHKIGDEIKHGILTLSDGLKIVGNTTSTTATKVNVQETDGTINTISKYDLVNVVEVNDVPSLPLVGEVGKIYVVKNLNKIYRWNGTYYTELAITDISGKVDKIVGKGLSTEDYTTPEKTKLAELFNYDPTIINNAIALKVDKVTGKSLLSDAEITRLTTLSNYTHPANHPPSIITQDANNRFVTDVEKATWNNKQATITTDSSLYLDPTTKELRLNIGESNQYFNYVSGVKEFTLVNEPASITYISINGVLLSNPFADYTINAALKKITINADVQPNSDINVNYKFIITQ